MSTIVPPEQDLLALRAELLERVNKGDFPSISIGVIKAGAVIWEESIGWADKELQRIATPRTPYGIASLGKSLTATALMLLVQQGKVDLNAPISQYLGDSALTVLAGTPDQVTLRRILNMTAGIPHGLMSFFNEADMLEYPLDRLLQNRGMVVFPPGEVYHYSNFSYMILEKVIENISGKSFADCLASSVFTPLAMADSFVGLRQQPGHTKMAVQYGGDGSRLLASYLLPQNSLAMYSSVDDLLRFAEVHLGTRPLSRQDRLSEQVLEQMHRNRGEPDHALLGLGLASIDLNEKGFWLLTNGRAGGMQATLSMLPSEGVAVACLINATGQDADDLAFRISEALVPGFLEDAMRVISEHETWGDQPYHPTPELLGEWRGFISSSSEQTPIRLLFQPDGNVYVTIGDQTQASLSDIGVREGLFDGRFTADLPMEEAAGHPHPVTISLRLKGMQLSGIITSEITNPKGRFLLGAFARLSKFE
ncbi:MAG: beta-lactamase family protein [Anaerolineales bacterium]|nr:beta-lactamase family protein [Anaerolineales bacterium]